MSNRRLQIPASLRKTFSNMSNSRVPAKPYIVSAPSMRTGVLDTKAFVALPKEDQDARITGATRSLDRRLLALNICGSLRNLTNRCERIDARTA